MTTPHERSDERLSRADQMSSVLGLVLAAVAAVAGLVLEDPWDDRLIAAAAFVAVVTVGVSGIRWSRRRRPVTEPVDLGPWRTAVRNVMRQSWVADGSPLDAVDELRQDLMLTGNDTWLHDQYRHATNLDNGDVVDLSDLDGAGGIWELLDGSYLVVGDAGAGKSVLLWQTLSYLLDTYNTTDATPLLIEAFHWGQFDHTPTTAPRFEDFIAWRLRDPALATPPEIAARLASHVILLVDGFDELVDLNPTKAARFLDAIGEARRSGRIDPRIVITTRPGQYKKLITKRGAGTSAVTHALDVEPYPIDTVIDTIKQLDPPPTHLLGELNRLDELPALLQRPLWLALTIELFRKPWDTSPFNGLTNPTQEQLQTVLYRAWLNRIGTDRTETWKQHAGYLASRMTTGTQTLTLDQIQGTWLPTPLHTHYRTTQGLIGGLAFGLVNGLVLGLAFGLDNGLVLVLAFGLVAGLVFGLVFGPDTTPVARQRFDIRRFSTSTALSLGMPIGLGGVMFGGLVAGLVAGLVFGLVFGLLDCFVTVPATSPPLNPYSSILIDARMNLIRGLTFGLAGGLVAGLVGGLTFGLAGGLASGLALGLVAGLGEIVAVNHGAARIVAARAGLLPLALLRFLDDLVAGGVMYRTGPGYRFRHRTLSAWIAQEWNTNQAVIDLTAQTGQPTTADSGIETRGEPRP